MAVLRYPYNAITTKTDYLQLDILNYTANGDKLVGASRKATFAAGNVAGEKVSNKSASLSDSILLPMPSNLQDGNSVKYADDSLNGLTAQAVEGVTKLMQSDPTKPTTFGPGLKSLMDLVTDPEIQKALGRTLAAQAVNIFGGNVTPDQILARQKGEIFNPNMELLFNGVTLRTFKFSFKMTPRNKPESDQVKLIIRSLKRNMAPQTGSESYFLKTPNIFELRYKQGNGDHPFLHKFKQCALTDMAVNYTGESIYATYGDATPVSMIMDLTFRELEPIYESDYVNGDGVDLDSTVGY